MTAQQREMRELRPSRNYHWTQWLRMSETKMLLNHENFICSFVSANAPSPALYLAPFGHLNMPDKAMQRRSALS